MRVSYFIHVQDQQRVNLTRKKESSSRERYVRRRLSFSSFRMEIIVVGSFPPFRRRQCRWIDVRCTHHQAIADNVVRDELLSSLAQYHPLEFTILKVRIDRDAALVRVLNQRLWTNLIDRFGVHAALEHQLIP